MQAGARPRLKLAANALECQLAWRTALPYLLIEWGHALSVRFNQVQICGCFFVALLPGGIMNAAALPVPLATPFAIPLAGYKQVYDCGDVEEALNEIKQGQN